MDKRTMRRATEMAHEMLVHGTDVYLAWLEKQPAHQWNADAIVAAAHWAMIAGEEGCGIEFAKRLAVARAAGQCKIPAGEPSLIQQIDALFEPHVGTNGVVPQQR